MVREKNMGLYENCVLCQRFSRKGLTARNVQFYAMRGGRHMAKMTLRELCDSLGVSRRAVQGYEKAGLVSAEGKNERGYLLYNEETKDKIERIKLYQQFGFTIKEIKWLLDAPASELKEALEGQVEKMKGEKREMDALIKKAYELINSI